MKKSEARKRIDMLIEYALSTEQVFMLKHLKGIKKALRKRDKTKGDW
jgi:hypothetical protein